MKASADAAEDVHVHIHFDGAAMPPQAQLPLVPPPFSPDYACPHYQDASVATSYPPHRYSTQTATAASRASARLLCKSDQQQFAAPSLARSVPLVPPPTLPLQPLTRLIDFDDSLADLVSQVEASMHVNGEATAHEPTVREASEHACTMLAELAPQYHESGGYRCDSATSVTGDRRDGLEPYIHAEHAYENTSSTKHHQMHARLGLGDGGYRQAQEDERLGTLANATARAMYVSTRCGDVRTTCRSGEVVSHAMHRSDTALHNASDTHWGGTNSREQENSSCYVRGAGGAVPASAGMARGAHSVCAKPSEQCQASWRGRQGGRSGMGWRATGSDAGKHSQNMECVDRSPNARDSRNFVGRGKYAQKPKHGLSVSPSCLDDQDREMLDVLNCLT